MKDIIQDVLSKLNIQKAFDSLVDHLPAKLAGSVECEQGKNPSNSTDIKPPKFKAMNEIVWNGECWEYQPME